MLELANGRILCFILRVDAKDDAAMTEAQIQVRLHAEFSTLCIYLSKEQKVIYLLI